EGPRSGRETAPYFFLPFGCAFTTSCSSRKAAAQNSGAFQLIVTSLADQASPLSMKHFWGAQPFRPADAMYGSSKPELGPPESTPGGGGGSFGFAWWHQKRWYGFSSGRAPHPVTML